MEDELTLPEVTRWIDVHKRDHVSIANDHSGTRDAVLVLRHDYDEHSKADAIRHAEILGGLKVIKFMLPALFILTVLSCFMTVWVLFKFGVLIK